MAAESGIRTLPIVEHLDVLEAILIDLFTRCVAPMMDQFSLEYTEETFDASVISAIVLAAYRAGNDVAASFRR